MADEPFSLRAPKDVSPEVRQMIEDAKAEPVWREVTIAYELRGRDAEKTDGAIIDAALEVLGCECDESTEICKAGDWVASARLIRDEDL